MAAVAIGIDVGLRWLHAVALDDRVVVEARVFPSDRLDAIVASAGNAAAIAIDSPDRWSSAPHADDLSLPPKFRTARCAEIGLGRQFGIWVSWATPASPVLDSWIAVGIELFAALRADGHGPLEVYPFACFRTLANGQPLRKKHTSAGRDARVALLHAAGLDVHATDHDTLDAAAAALVAHDHLHHRARAATCHHDGTAIWLPAGVTEPSGAALRHR